MTREVRFYDEQGNIRPELFDRDAKTIAKELIQTSPNRKGQTVVQGVSRHQLRRIFDEVKRLQKTHEQKQDWDTIFPLVKLVKSKVAYTVARMKKTNSSESRYYDNLETFVVNGIDQIREPEDLDTFVLLFEAVYGFYYQMGGAQTK